MTKAKGVRVHMHACTLITQMGCVAFVELAFFKKLPLS